MTAQPVNLKKLAEHLGLSQTTVSRALNGFPEVAEATRKRVVQAAETLNYRPSLSAASLATGKSWSIGHVVPLSDHKMINPHFSDFIAGAGEIYADNHYDMLIRVVSSHEELSTYRDLIAKRRIDGFVIHGPVNNDPRIKLLLDARLPFVVHGRSDGRPDNYPRLDVNNKSAFSRATKLLIDLGHKRIALLNGLETMNFAKRRREGFEAAMKDENLPVDPNLIASADMVEPYGFEAARDFLKTKTPPTAFLASSILVAMGIRRAIAEAGLKPGKDISIIAFDDQLSFLQADFDSSQPPYFTALQSSIRNAGRRVAEMLIDQINHPGSRPAQELWEAQLVLGATTGPRKPNQFCR